MAGYTYTKINWENEPSYNTPINETNLNHMDQGIFDLAYVKAEKNDAVFVNSISLDRKAGTTVGLDSVAAGYDTEATGPSSVAIGTNTSAKNGQAVAGGYNSKALGNTSLALGTHCITRLNAAESQAIGNNCIAGSANQMVFGQYNVEDTTGTYAEIVGNGSSGNESNARTLDWQGNETIAGDFTNGNGETLHGIYEALPVDTESGNPAVITDAFGGACKSLKLTLEPIQSGSGTPSPQNVRPIIGRTQSVVTRRNRNALPFINETKSQSGLEVAPKSGGRYDFTGTSLANTAIQLTMSVSLAGVYKFVADGYTQTSGSNISLYVQNKGGGGLAAISPNTDIDFDVKEVVSLAFYAGTGAVCNYHDVGFALIPDSVTDKSFEPYVTPESITRTYGTTVYGGSDDVTGDGVTVTYDALVVSADTSIERVATNTTGKYRFYLTPPSVPTEPSSVDVPGDITSSVCLKTTAYNTYTCMEGASIREGRIILYLDAISGMSEADAKAYLVGIGAVFAYPLATSTTISFASQNITLLHGDNVLTTDADSIEVSYSADIALYIAKKIAEGISQGNRSLSKGGVSEEEPKEEETKEEEKEVVEIKEEEPLTKEVR